MPNDLRIKLNFVKQLRIKIREKSLEQPFDVAMTSLSIDKDKTKKPKPKRKNWLIYTKLEDRLRSSRINYKDSKIPDNKNITFYAGYISSKQILIRKWLSGT